MSFSPALGYTCISFFLVWASCLITVFVVWKHFSKPLVDGHNHYTRTLKLLLSVAFKKIVFRAQNIDVSTRCDLDAILLDNGAGPLIFSSSQWLLGLGFFLFPWASAQLRSWYLPLHVFFGLLLLAMSIGTCLLGITEKLLFNIMWVSFNKVSS